MGIRHMVRWLVVACAVAIATPAPAAMPGCGADVSPALIAICHDRELTSLYQEVEKAYFAYREELNALSPDAAAVLDRTQKIWVGFVSAFCVSSEPGNNPAGNDAGECYRSAFADRFSSFKSSSENLGPFIFASFSLSAPALAPDGTNAGVRGFFVNRAGFTLIARPRTPETDAWNANIMKTIKDIGFGSGGDEDRGCDIGFVSERVISLRWEASWEGASHPQTSAFSENVVFDPAPRPMVVQDVFGTGNSWVQPFLDLVWAAVPKDPGFDHACCGRDNYRSAINDVAIQPDHWLFTSEGLTINFNPYETVPYICTFGPIVLPWSGLRPLMAANSVVQ